MRWVRRLNKGIRQWKQRNWNETNTRKSLIESNYLNMYYSCDIFEIRWRYFHGISKWLGCLLERWECAFIHISYEKNENFVKSPWSVCVACGSTFIHMLGNDVDFVSNVQRKCVFGFLLPYRWQATIESESVMCWPFSFWVAFFMTRNDVNHKIVEKQHHQPKGNWICSFFFVLISQKSFEALAQRIIFTTQDNKARWVFSYAYQMWVCVGMV